MITAGWPVEFVTTKAPDPLCVGVATLLTLTPDVAVLHPPAPPSNVPRTPTS
jgi:hypothetical protein